MVMRLIVLIALCAASASAVGLRDVIARMSAGGGAVAGHSTSIFTYTGSNQYFTVPAGVTRITIQAWGAAGGGANNGASGGNGGYSVATNVAVTPGESLLVEVGGGGRVQSNVQARAYPSGGLASTDQYPTYIQGNGGGRSGVARDSTYLLIAGAGGGGAYQSGQSGGDGGGTNGATGGYNIANPGTGGSQAAGGVTNGAYLYGGNGMPSANSLNGGGGDGYYGGGGGYRNGGGSSAGGGGSGYSAGSLDLVYQGLSVWPFNYTAGTSKKVASSSGNNGLVVVTWGDSVYESVLAQRANFKIDSNLSGTTLLDALGVLNVPLSVGVASNASTTINGKQTLAFYCNGATRMQSAATTSTMFSRPSTLAFWFNATTYGTNGVKQYERPIIECWAGINRATMLDNVTQKIQLFYNDGTNRYLQSNASITTGQWYHVCITADTSNWTLYINGTLDTNTTALSWAKTSTGNNSQCFGYSPNTDGRYYNGWIDDVSIFTNLFTAEQVKILYQNTPTGE